MWAQARPTGDLANPAVAKDGRLIQPKVHVQAWLDKRSQSLDLRDYLLIFVKVADSSATRSQGWSTTSDRRLRTVLRSLGCSQFGEISCNGFRTKALRCARGCGSIGSGEARISVPTAMISRSSVRAALMPVRTRPKCRSIS